MSVVLNTKQYQTVIAINGATTHCQYGNDLATAYTYNPYGLLTRIHSGNQILLATEELPDVDIKFFGNLSYATADSTILNYRYAYNNRGLITSRSENILNRQETFSYDYLDRLTTKQAYNPQSLIERQEKFKKQRIKYLERYLNKLKESA